MKRAVEIINALRAGMETMLKDDTQRRVNMLRLFNFEKNRVSLRMELVDKENICQPMGLIDVVEFPNGNHQKGSCNCHITELATGKSEKILLRLHNQEDKKIECQKVFNFFRKTLQLPSVSNLSDIPPIGQTEPTIETIDSSQMYPPADGKLPINPRGAK